MHIIEIAEAEGQRTRVMVGCEERAVRFENYMRDQGRDVIRYRGMLTPADRDDAEYGRGMAYCQQFFGVQS